jgi:hypothetical protein
MTDLRRQVTAPVSALRHALGGREGGQMAVMLAPMALLFIVFGLAVVDFGQWFSIKRDVQGDADAIALAGAIELPSFVDDDGAVDAAQAAALSWAAKNNVDPSDVTVEVIDTCFSSAGDVDDVHTGVRATVERVPTSYFLGLFPGAPTPTIRASAVACTGTPADQSNFLPWAVERTGDCFTDDPNPELRIPILGARCSISVGGSGSEQGDVGQLGFEPNGDCPDGNAGADVYETNIELGVPTTCVVGDAVSSNAGVNVGKTQSGLEARLATEGACSVAAMPLFPMVQTDTLNFNLHPTLENLLLPTSGNNGGGVDDFFEVFRPSFGYDLNDPGANLSVFDCDPSTPSTIETSPRHVAVVVIDDFGTSDGVGCSGGGAQAKCYEVRGFVDIYIEGCSTNAGFDAKCAQGGAGGSFTVHARMVGVFAVAGGRLTLNRFGGLQTFLKE